MNIGVITQNSRTITRDGEEVKQEWLEMAVRPVFMESATLSVHANKNKKNQNEPDYNLWYNFSRKGEKFRGAKVGAMWRKTSKDGKTEYFSGHIENPLVYGGKMYISAFKAKPMGNEKAENINWLYDVVWQPPKGGGNQNQNNYNGGGYVPETDYSQADNSGGGNMNQEQMDSEASLYM